MDQGLGPERLRRPAEGAVGPGGQRQCGQGTVKAERDHCEMFGVKLLEKHKWFSGVQVVSLSHFHPPGEEGLPGSCNAAWLQ